METFVYAPRATKQLDFELEIAAIIGTEVSDLPSDDSRELHCGFTIYNDWSARDLQRQEMQSVLGRAKARTLRCSRTGAYSNE